MKRPPEIAPTPIGGRPGGSSLPEEFERLTFRSGSCAPFRLIPSHSAQTPIFANLNRHPKTLALIDLSRNSVYHFVYTRDMKTITLDDAAYERLKALKRGRGDSFSAVVKRVVPVSGTLGAFLSYVEANGPGDDARDEVLENSVTNRPLGEHDPWT